MTIKNYPTTYTFFFKYRKPKIENQKFILRFDQNAVFIVNPILHLLDDTKTKLNVEKRPKIERKVINFYLTL